MRDEFYNTAQKMKEEEEWAWKSIFYRIGIILSIYIVYDLYKYYKSQKHKDYIEI